jgi:hypothetical protein
MNVRTIEICIIAKKTFGKYIVFWKRVIKSPTPHRQVANSMSLCIPYYKSGVFMSVILILVKTLL